MSISKTNTYYHFYDKEVSLSVIGPLISLLRPHQYVKNFFLFLPLFFSLKFFELDLLLQTFLGFIIFSAVSSSVYIINDIKDINEDRSHPVKCKRPIASGIINIKTGLTISGTLLLISCFSSLLLNINFFLVIIFYFALNILYSFYFKYFAILDVITIALGFVLRLAAGSFICYIPLSSWIILLTFLLALFLGFAKRREDLILHSNGKLTRKNITGYNIEFINSSMVMLASGIIISYIFYTLSNQNQEKFHSDKLFYTVFFVITGILRYLQVTQVQEKSGNPTEVLWSDRFLQIVIACWLISFLIIIY